MPQDKLSQFEICQLLASEFRDRCADFKEGHFIDQLDTLSIELCEPVNAIWFGYSKPDQGMISFYHNMSHQYKLGMHISLYFQGQVLSERILLKFDETKLYAASISYMPNGAVRCPCCGRFNELCIRDGIASADLAHVLMNFCNSSEYMTQLNPEEQVSAGFDHPWIQGLDFS